MTKGVKGWGLGPQHHNWNGGKTNSHGYVRIFKPEHHRADPYGYTPEHIVIVEQILGKNLPLKAEIHHVNGNRADNNNQNLVVCENKAYHRLLHQRQKALEISGHANWLKCRYCHEYDDPQNMYVGINRGVGRQGRHRHCHTLYEKTRRKHG